MKWKVCICGVMLVCSFGMISTVSADNWDDGDWGYTTTDEATGWFDTDYADSVDSDEWYDDTDDDWDDDDWEDDDWDDGDWDDDYDADDEEIEDDICTGWSENSDFFKDGSDIDYDEYILPESEYMYLTKSDISNLTKKGLCYARNEIYARYGRKFKASELQEYFDNTTWYRAKYEPCEANDKAIIKKMNKYEKYNVDLLISIEKKSGMYSVK